MKGLINENNTIFLIFIFVLSSCASKHITINSSTPSRVELDGVIVCNSTPCDVKVSCSHHGQGTYLSASPIDKSKGYVQKKVVRGDCSVGSSNQTNVFFDLSEKVNNEAEISQEITRDHQLNQMNATKVEAASKAGQQVGDAVSGKNIPNNRDVRNKSYGCGIRPLVGYNCNAVCVDGQWHEVCK